MFISFVSVAISGISFLFLKYDISNLLSKFLEMGSSSIARVTSSISS